MSKKMLEGIKVIDLSRNLAAPFATMILSDLGAEVIKVEQPVTGDDARRWGPLIGDKSGYFLSVNRGKKSVILNLKEPGAKEKLGELIKEADVMVDNFRPGVLDKWGITHEWVDCLNPRLIFASLTGFGHTGPYREKAAFDMVVQGYGGIMSVTGSGPNSEPTRVGISIGDLAAGLYLTIGILADLYAREHTNQGDRLDVAMLDCQVALLENTMIRYFASGEITKPAGNRHASITPFEMYPSSDGYLIVCAGNEKQWGILCEIIGLPELEKDEKYYSNDKRNENHDELNVIITSTLKKKTTKEWIDIMEGAGVPCGPVNNIKNVMENEQVLARDMVVTVDYSDIGPVKSPGCPIKTKNYHIDVKRPAPDLGQHSKEVFGEDINS
ncbi:MAG: carnitine dehydratase [Firmicutes bacterium HGW-Firmicutes-12]|jgi:CoA:oxalate CoA-transferase|nr:MAG: carnitine dehydratase [Firmicutes bacterium HGW-Firmicutes-12]